MNTAFSKVVILKTMVRRFQVESFSNPSSSTLYHTIWKESAKLSPVQQLSVCRCENFDIYARSGSQEGTVAAERRVHDRAEVSSVRVHNFRYTTQNLIHNRAQVSTSFVCSGVTDRCAGRMRDCEKIADGLRQKIKTILKGT